MKEDLLKFYLYSENENTNDKNDLKNNNEKYRLEELYDKIINKNQIIDEMRENLLNYIKSIKKVKEISFLFINENQEEITRDILSAEFKKLIEMIKSEIQFFFEKSSKKYKYEYYLTCLSFKKDSVKDILNKNDSKKINIIESTDGKITKINLNKIALDNNFDYDLIPNLISNFVKTDHIIITILTKILDPQNFYLPIIESNVNLVFLNKSNMFKKYKEEKNYLVKSLNMIYNQKDIINIYNNLMISKLMRNLLKQDQFVYLLFGDSNTNCFYNLVKEIKSKTEKKTKQKNDMGCFIKILLFKTAIIKMEKKINVFQTNMEKYSIFVLNYFGIKSLDLFCEENIKINLKRNIRGKKNILDSMKNQNRELMNFEQNIYDKVKRKKEELIGIEQIIKNKLILLNDLKKDVLIIQDTKLVHKNKLQNLESDFVKQKSILEFEQKNNFIILQNFYKNSISKLKLFKKTFKPNCEANLKNLKIDLDKQKNSLEKDLNTKFENMTKKFNEEFLNKKNLYETELKKMKIKIDQIYLKKKNESKIIKESYKKEKLIFFQNLENFIFFLKSRDLEYNENLEKVLNYDFLFFNYKYFTQNEKINYMEEIRTLIWDIKTKSNQKNKLIQDIINKKKNLQKS